MLHLIVIAKPLYYDIPFYFAIPHSGAPWTRLHNLCRVSRRDLRDRFTRVLERHV